MKNLFKISLLSLCILFLSDSVICSTKVTPPLKADEGYQIQPTSISDITYTILIWTESGGIFPKYFPQFEFDAGDVFKATSVSSEYSELTGTWTETDFVAFTHFTARVEASEEETTTTTTADTSATQDILIPQSIEPEKTSFLINLWGISLDFTPPPPFDTIAFSMLFGAGAYLGTDVFFTGFAGTETEEPDFGSVSPNEGEQGQTIDVTITGINTTFERAGTITVDFGEGIDVGSTGVKNDTELNVEISIQDEAKVGDRTVSVTYDSTVISEAAAFTVTEKIE